MIWRKLVTRRVAPLATALFDESYLQTVDRCRQEGIEMPVGLSIDNILFVDSTHHVDLQRLMPFFQSLIRVFDEQDHDVFLKMADTIEKEGQEFLAYLEELSEAPFDDMGKQAVADHFKEFLQQYVRFASLAIAPPFAVEFMYNTRFRRMVSGLADRLVEGQEDLGKTFLDHHLAQTADNLRAQALSLLTRALDVAVGMTFAERRNLTLYKIAANIVLDPAARRVFESKEPVSADVVERDFPIVHRMITEALAAFGWLKQWSLPPYYQPYSYEEFLEEIQAKVKEGPDGELRELERGREEALALHDEAIAALDLSEHEAKFLETVVRFNLIRTWRMEVNIRSMFCLRPLCDRLGRIACDEGLLADPGDVYFLTHWEIEEYLDTGKVPTDIPERREDYAMTVLSGQVDVLSGTRLREFKDKFYAVIDFRENGRGVHGHEVGFVGGKAENLFTLHGNRLAVPRFFVLTSDAYQQFVRENALEDLVQEILLVREHVEARIRECFMNVNIPTAVEEAVLEQMRVCGLSEVTVRSSATVEDSPEFSWAGRFDSIGYVTTDTLFDSVKLVWASLFTERALAYAEKAKINLGKQAMAVIIQEMIEPDLSGVANTTLSAAAKDVMEIEVAYGQGAAIVSGEITPDRYLVRKGPEPTIIEKYVSAQTRKITRAGWKEIEPSLAQVQKLSDAEIIRLAGVLADIERMYEAPQDVEFCMAGDQLYILQSRPQTGLGEVGKPTGVVGVKGALLLAGMRGKVEAVLEQTARVLLDPDQGDKLETGQILVTEAATPVWDLITFRAGGLVTNEGGSTCHAIRVSNEMGIPAVVGTGKATVVIRDGDRITIDTTDPFRGKVYRQ